MSAVGAGGMGEVYRARDSRLDRQVAIKVLPEHLSANPGLRERFEREAKVISGLSHPHICTLYDVGEFDGREYLVMEYLEGESLAARLERGPLPADQALRIGMALASALDKAHRSGIVHRDLKPANIMLTRDGAKLLDFGLAKLKPQPIAVAAAALTELTADDRKLTAEGTIVGTFQYMAPEQLEGADADMRTDIFALGAVLYEMVTGKPAFAGKTKASLIAAILSAEPAPIQTLQPMSPPALDRVIRACIAKDPEDRIQTAHDLRLQLALLAESGSQFGSTAVALPAPRARAARIYTALGLAAAVVLVALLAYWLGTRQQPEAPIIRTSITLPADHRLPRISNSVLALSPDGSTVVYSAVVKGEMHLFVRRLGEFTSTLIPGTEGAFGASISPDGEWVAFSGRNRSLRKVRLSGGAAMQISDKRDLVGVHWADDGNIYFSRWAEGIYAVSADGGELRQITKPGSAPDDRSHVWPQLLPGGKHLLFTVWTGKSFDDARIEVVELATGNRTVVATGGTLGQYVRSGHLLWARGGILLAQPFDLKTLRTTGSPVPVIEGVHTGAANGDARLAVASNGTLAYVAGTFSPIQREMVLIDRTGKATRVTEMVRPFSDSRMSPDGRFIATTVETSTFDIWLLDIARDTLTRFTFGADESDPLWSPDGRSLVYTSSAHGRPDLFIRRLDSNDPPRQLTDDAAWEGACCWSGDGELLIFTASDRGNSDVWAVSVKGDGKSRPLVEGPGTEFAAAASPDGKWLAYGSDKSGRMEVYVRAVSGQSREWQISRDGALGAMWMPDGREILLGAQDAIWSVTLKPGDDLDPSRPVKLFDDPDPGADWDFASVTPDGRLLVTRDTAQPSDQADIRLVQNWFSELRAKVR